LFDYPNFKIVALDDFDLPVVKPIFLKHKICVVVLVDAHRSFDGNSVEIIVSKMQIFIAMVGIP
jgi:hypothetical protein